MDKEIAQKKDPRAEWVKNQTGLGFFVVKSNANFEVCMTGSVSDQLDIVIQLPKNRYIWIELTSPYD